MQTIHIQVKDEALQMVLSLLEPLKSRGVSDIAVDAPSSGLDADYYQALSTTLAEWYSDEDEEAFSDL